MPRYKEGIYFNREDGMPEPVSADIRRRVNFSDADPMGIVWFGRYPRYFEEGSAELGRVCGLSYGDFYEAGLRAPVVKCHIDYFSPLYIDESFTIRARLIWNESSRLDTEYLHLKDDGSLASSGYTIQMLTDVKGEICLVSPPLLVKCRERWKRGEFHGR